MNRLRQTLLGGLALGLLAAGFLLPAARAEEMQLLPPPALTMPTPKGMQVAVLSGGCFWGVQGAYEHVKGVRRVLAGYTGGAAGTAHYEIVSEGDTGHAESVEIEYDPAQISYGQILQIFFSVVADPTTLNRQGPDSGTQYRSEIWAETPAQAQLAKAYIAQLDKGHLFTAPIVTRVDPAGSFYPAENYHQDFLVREPDYPYIVYNDLPKVAALQRYFPQFYLAAPVLSGVKS